MRGGCVQLATNRGAVVATAFPAASAAGCEVVRRGGNAVDAAVAAAWALSVCEPAGSGLGGQTTLLMRLADGRMLVVDGHSCAPAQASRRTITRPQQRHGYRATTVPTTPATLSQVQAAYGRLSASAVLAPAVALAEDGFQISRLQSKQLRWCCDQLRASPSTRRFLRDGRPYLPGETFRQPDLARCLRRLAEHGVSDFYRGEIGRAITGDMRQNHGLLDGADLERVGPIPVRKPVAVAYGSHTVLAAPPPGGGVELLLGLRLLERHGLEGSVEPWHQRIAESTYAAFAAREHDLAHPDEWTSEQQELLLGDERVARIARNLSGPVLASAGATSEGPGETTHLCTADTAGNVVSLTQSIQSLFGAKVANAKYGFLYNNYLTTCPRRPHRYRLGPLAPARSNAAPALVLGGEGGAVPVLALGGAGSRRIISALLHVISARLDQGLTLQNALDVPRVHARLNGTVWLERAAGTPETLEALTRRFPHVELKPRRSYCMGAVQAVELRPDGLDGAADPRRDGTACAC